MAWDGAHSRRQFLSTVTQAMPLVALAVATKAAAQPGRLRFQEVARVPLGSWATSLAWSPDASRIAAAVKWGSEVVVLNTATWRVVASFPRSQEIADETLGFAAGGREIVTLASDRRTPSPWAFGVYETETGRQLRLAPQPEEPKVVIPPSRLCVSPDGRYVVLTARMPGGATQVMLYDVPRAAFLGAIRPPRPAGFDVMSINRANRLAIAATYLGPEANPWIRKTIQIFDLPSLLALHVIPAHVPSIRSLAWSPDGQRLASGAHGIVEAIDPATGMPGVTRDADPIRVWNPATGELQRSYAQPVEPISHIAWHPDSSRFLTTSAKGTGEFGTMVQGFSVDQPQPLVRHLAPPGQIITVPCFNPRGDRVAWSEDRAIRVMSLVQH